MSPDLKVKRSKLLWRSRSRVRKCQRVERARAAGGQGLCTETVAESVVHEMVPGAGHARSCTSQMATPSSLLSSYRGALASTEGWARTGPCNCHNQQHRDEAAWLPRRSHKAPQTLHVKQPGAPRPPDTAEPSAPGKTPAPGRPTWPSPPWHLGSRPTSHLSDGGASPWGEPPTLISSRPHRLDRV